MSVVFITIFTAILAYFLGRVHGFFSAARHFQKLMEYVEDPFVEAQRERSHLQ